MVSTITPEEQERVFKILKEIEELGGSAAYKANPQVFEAVLPEDLKRETDYEQRKRDVIAAIDKLVPVIKDKWKELANAEELKSKLIKRIGERKITKEERNLKLLQAVERLGGSAGFGQYIEKLRASPDKHRWDALGAIRVHVIGDGVWDVCFASGPIWSSGLYITSIEVYCDLSGSGYAWGVAMGNGWFCGWCNHLPQNVLLAESNSLDKVVNRESWVEAIISTKGEEAVEMYGVVAGTGLSCASDRFFDWNNNRETIWPQ